MTPLRLVLVTRRFWPLVGGAETAMANLAAQFVSQGSDVTLLTAQWSPNWPSELNHHGVRVVRLPHSDWRFYGTLIYMRALSRWIRQRRHLIDLIYVSMLKHDAYAVLGAAARSGVPVVLRAEGAGATGDVFWQLEANFGRRIKQRCHRANGFVAPSPAIEQELIAGGYARDRIHYLPNGVKVPPQPGTNERSAARRALADSQAALALPDSAPLAVYTGRLDQAKGLLELVTAWQTVSEHQPDARLWLVGDGPARGELESHIGDLALTRRVVLTGSYDCVDEILSAADLFVLPSYAEGLSMSLLEAMATGLPVVASDIPGNRTLIEDDQHGLLVPPRSAQTLAQAICRVFDDPTEAAQFGAAARRRVSQEFSLATMTGRHQSLFTELIAAGDRSRDT